MQKVGAVSILGRRKENEDQHVVFYYRYTPVDLQVLAVFDGHQGKEASQYCAEHFEEIFVQNVQNCNFDIKQAMKFTLLTLNNNFININRISGCTACVFVHDRAAQIAYTANVGDSRCIFRANGLLYEATRDHKPGDENERERLEKLGQKVIFAGGVARLNGKLAVSRSIGDGDQKQYGLIAEPELFTYQVGRGVEYCIVACDGLYDVMKSSEVDQLVMKTLFEEETAATNREKMPKDVFDAFQNFYECATMSGDALLKHKCKKKILEKTMCEDPEEADSAHVRIAKALARVAFWLGSNDNISIIFACEGLE